MNELLKRMAISRMLSTVDSVLLYAFTGALVLLIATSTKVNICHDSVDYYGMLQWVTPEREEPIVKNLHFAEQRSPGYILLSLIPYSLLTTFVEPFVTTEQINEYAPSECPTQRTRQMSGFEMMSLPPQPLQVKDLFFKDYYVPTEASWYQWKLALSLLLTSCFFLFVGIWANATVLRMHYPESRCLFIIPLTLASAHMLMRSIVDVPLFTTLTCYGLAALFLLSISLSFRSRKSWYVILSASRWVCLS